jgi:ATP-binding cassette subfamily D (ALD) protein 3
MFLSQRTYLPLGSLRRQLIYPDNDSDRKIEDDELLRFVHLMGLDGLVEREGSLSAVRPWQEVLSGGERQRIALVRVLYHHPMFALLDECTNALGQDDELRCLLLLQQQGVTVVCVSHRFSLRAVFSQVVNLDDFKAQR